ncbi:MAG: hypothetical protein LBK25_01710 [Treponema sp.]|nr:hypothetical protein [Treponema sp.]
MSDIAEVPLASKRNRHDGDSGTSFQITTIGKSLNTRRVVGGWRKTAAGGLETGGRTTRAPVCRPPFRERRAPLLNNLSKGEGELKCMRDQAGTSISWKCATPFPNGRPAIGADRDAS